MQFAVRSRLIRNSAALLSCALIHPFSPMAFAQNQTPRTPVIDTTEGFNAVNRMGRDISSATVRVIDQNQRPIGKAVVTFELPENGVYLDGSRKADVETNEMGEAKTPNICPIGPGDFPISVTATVDNQRTLATVPQTNQNPQFEKLIVTSLQGNNAVNSTRQQKATEPVVAVTNENKAPVACALVTFSLPKAGPSGVFGNSQLTFSSRTDAEGKVKGAGLRPNSQSGKVLITVTASLLPLSAATSITQTNKGSGHTGLIIALIVVAGAGGGAAAALGKGHGSSTTTPATPSPTVITISPGTGGFGTPPIH